MSSTDAPVYETSSDTFKKRFMWRLIIVLTGGMLLDGYILGVIGPVTPALEHDLGLSAIEIGLGDGSAGDLDRVPVGRLGG